MYIKYLLSFNEEQSANLKRQTAKAVADVRGEMTELLAVPYVRKFHLKGDKTDYVLTMSPLQSLLWYTCETIEIDFTYCENKDLPKVLHFCANSHLMDKYTSPWASCAPIPKRRPPIVPLCLPSDRRRSEQAPLQHLWHRKMKPQVWHAVARNWMLGINGALSASKRP